MGVKANKSEFRGLPVALNRTPISYPPPIEEPASKPGEAKASSGLGVI